MKFTQKTVVTPKPSESKHPHITFKKAQSSPELTDLNRSNNPTPQSPLMRKRLSLTNVKSKVNDYATQIKNASSRHPSKDLYVIGITGVNGKTSVSYLIEEVLKSAGYKPFVLGKLNSGNTDSLTPVSVDIEKCMRGHLEQGGTHFIMEVTSEGVDQTKVLGIDFNIKLLTNITQDHLDYHKTFEMYQHTKLDFMHEGTAHKIHPQSFKKEPISFTTKLLEDFNLLNLKAAASILRYMKVSENIIQKTLSSCSLP